MSLQGLWRDYGGPVGVKPGLEKQPRRFPEGRPAAPGKQGSQECPAPGHPLGLRGGESAGGGGSSWMQGKYPTPEERHRPQGPGAGGRGPFLH